MKSDTLEFLTPRDWEQLREMAQSRVYERGVTILEGGTYSQAIFVIHEGIVRVEQAGEDGLGRGIALAQLGPGEVFGEMAFLEGRGASASIIAESQVRVDRLEQVHLQALLASDSGLAVRFYQSLASSLARRLRKTSRRLSHLNVGEVAQVNRFHNPRTGNISARQIPAELASTVEAFQMALLAVDEGLKARRLSEAQVQAQVSAACDQIPLVLGRYTQGESLVEMGWDDLLAFRDTPQLENGVGDYVFREIFPSLMLSATIARYYTKPRGFVDDYETLDMVYRAEPEGDDRLGPYIDQWFLDWPVCQARRSSRRFMTGLIRKALQASGRDVLSVTSLGSGAAHEIFDLYLENPALVLESTCIDVDDQALQFANQRATDLNCNDHMAFVQANVLLVAQGRADLALPPQRLIYALGLCDYLTDDEVLAVLGWAHTQLLPGGEIVVSNLEPAPADCLFMEHILEWQLHHRSEAQLRELFHDSPFGEPAAVEHDSTGVSWFATAVK